VSRKRESIGEFRKERGKEGDRQTDIETRQKYNRTEGQKERHTNKNGLIIKML
jgi:hypothetical protein